MKVRWSIVLLAAFGIVAALAAAVLTASLSAGQIQAVMPSAPKDVTILVASMEMKAMSMVDAESIVEKVVSAEDAPPRYYTEPAQIIGKVLSLPLIEGQAFSKGSFPQEGSGLHLASYLPMGKRAVNVSLSDYSGLEGLLYPGSIVDVLASFKISSSSKIGRAVSTTLLQNIEVIAVENLTIVSNSEVAEAAARTSGGMRKNLLITLMVDSRQAEALQLAIEHGSIALAMRNPGDREIFQSDATLLSDGLLAQLADMLGPQVLEEDRSATRPASDDIELAAIEGGSAGGANATVVARAQTTRLGDADSNGGTAAAARQFRESVTKRYEPEFWNMEIIRGLISDHKQFPIEN